MQQQTKRGLTKIALALVLAGYCAVPTAMADEQRGNLKAGQWQSVTGSTGAFNGTIPWLNRKDDVLVPVSADTGHVTVTIERNGRSGPGGDTSSDAYKQLHIGDTITVTWGIGDTEGDVDDGSAGADVKTKETIQWFSYSDQNGGDEKEIGRGKGKNVLDISDEEANRYIGLKITPTTQTGVPAEGTPVKLLDLSTNAGGGADDDDIPEGPVVDENIQFALYKDGGQDNLLGGSTPIALNATYTVRIYRDINQDGEFNTGDVDVTDQYHYRWRLDGTSAQLHTAGGIINGSWNDKPLVVPVTNAEAKTAFDNAGGLTLAGDGVQGYTLSFDYQRK